MKKREKGFSYPCEFPVQTLIRIHVSMHDAQGSNEEAINVDLALHNGCMNWTHALGEYFCADPVPKVLRPLL